MPIDIASELPFVRRSEDGKLLVWDVTPTGVYVTDTFTGRSHADALVAFMQASGNTAILGHIVSAIGASEHGGIETGFFNRIAEFAAQSGLKSTLPRVKLIPAVSRETSDPAS